MNILSPRIMLKEKIEQNLCVLPTVDTHFQESEMWNSVPLSDNIITSAPMLHTTTQIKAVVTDSVVLSTIGPAVTKCVKGSIKVSIY